MGPPESQPGIPGSDPMGAQPPKMPPQGGPGAQPQAPEDITSDPQYPDMPEDEGDQDFENWKRAFVKESSKGDPNVLEQMLLQVRDKELDDYPHKFVEDNWAIVSMRQHKDVLLPSNDIRKLIKKELDRTNPASSLVEHITTTLEENPLLNKVYLRCAGVEVPNTICTVSSLPPY